MYLNICRLLTRTCVRQIHTSESRNLMKDHSDNTFRKKLRSTAFYWSGVGILVVGLSYSAVPLYRMFCQSYSYGGTLSTGHDASKVSTMKPFKNKKIKIMFNADVASSMQWNFKPQQKEITVVPGETALAFYTATNPTDTQIVGISTYNVLPFEVGQYFNKIQCFCFEEQMLNPHEQVDMPVFFFIDPEFIEDPRMEFIDEIVLSYTFFEAKPGFNLPVPSYVKSHSTK
ncbi:PREDICTED: cytochrome c oxidase assembly protein COX11, mitochondrial [Atta cephalotes]|uniref:Cytochrome c oxidase assembly protein COX11, mitochondrial n=1 Tax=Atta cephalotes TaxID=12957 RepID=A0A158NT83_ATTCE|nr:PREDICTED: cytochrome c oxidase assembly protein COX11, mitochondrial [Atta cephalotes]